MYFLFDGRKYSVDEILGRQDMSQDISQDCTASCGQQARDGFCILAPAGAHGDPWGKPLVVARNKTTNAPHVCIRAKNRNAATKTGKQWRDEKEFTSTWWDGAHLGEAMGTTAAHFCCDLNVFCDEVPFSQISNSCTCGVAISRNYKFAKKTSVKHPHNLGNIVFFNTCILQDLIS